MTDREFIAWCRTTNAIGEKGWARLEGLAGPWIVAARSPFQRQQLCEVVGLRLDLAEAREDTARLTFMFGDLRGARAEIDAARGKA